MRGQEKISQLALAEKADLAHNFINDIENSKKWPSDKTIGKLAAALKVEPYQFFLSESHWNEQGAEILLTYLDDLSHSFNKMLDEYRSRYFPNETGLNNSNGKTDGSDRNGIVRD